MIEPGLLRAIGTQMAIRQPSELDEWSEKAHGRDVRTGLGRREKLNVIVQKGRIVALAEEIGLADGLVGERNIEGRCGHVHPNSHEKTSGDANSVVHDADPKRSIALILALAARE